MNCCLPVGSCGLAWIDTREKSAKRSEKPRITGTEGRAGCIATPGQVWRPFRVHDCNARSGNSAAGLGGGDFLGARVVVEIWVVLSSNPHPPETEGGAPRGIHLRWSGKRGLKKKPPAGCRRYQRRGSQSSSTFRLLSGCAGGLEFWAYVFSGSALGARDLIEFIDTYSLPLWPLRQRSSIVMQLLSAEAWLDGLRAFTWRGRG